MYIYISHLLNPFMHEWKLKLFPYLVIVNNATMDLEVQIHLQDTDFVSFVYILRRGLLACMAVLL